MGDLCPFGIDPGNGAIKVRGPAGGLQLPAHVAADAQGARATVRVAGLGAAKPPRQIRSAAGVFYVGPGAHDWGRAVENMDHDRFTGTPELRALVYGALTSYAEQFDGLPPALDLTVGLPVEPLTGDDEAVRATVTAVKRWLEGQHTWEADGRSFTVAVENVAITLQPAGALYDYLLDLQGAFVPARKAHFAAEIGVVSIGMNTIEALLVRGGKLVPGETHGARLGVRRLLELCNPEELYTQAELDGQLRAGRLDVGAALPIWSSEVIGLLERRWGAKHRRFACVVLVGGGVQLLRQPLMARFAGKAFIPDDPVLATARGLYKFTCLQHGRKRG